MRKRIVEYPIISYFLISYIFTWIFHLLIPLLGFQFTMSLNQPGIFLYLIGLWGPLVSSIIVTFHIKGKGGIRLLLSSGLKWRFSIAWY
ncbi:MAG: hypothetical protein ACQESM_08750, partial [Bacteroidota bacterium]